MYVKQANCILKKNTVTQSFLYTCIQHFYLGTTCFGIHLRAIETSATVIHWAVLRRVVCAIRKLLFFPLEKKQLIPTFSSVHLRIKGNGYTLKGGSFLKNVLVILLDKGPLQREIWWSWDAFFPFREDPFSERALFIGKQTESCKSHSLQK